MSKCIIYLLNIKG